MRNLWTLLLTLALAVTVPFALTGCPTDDDDSADDDDDASDDDDDATDDDDDATDDDDDDVTGDDDDVTGDDDDVTGDDDDVTGDDDSTGDDDTTSPWDGSIEGTLTANGMAPTAASPYTMKVILVDNADWAANGFAATPLQEATFVSDLPAAYTIGFTEGQSVEVVAFLDENENGTLGDAGDLATFSMAPVTVSATAVDLDFMMAVP